LASNSRIRLLQTAAALALAGAPVYWLQGRKLRRRVPRLEEAPGKRSGSLAGSGPALRIVGLGESPMAAVGLADQTEGVIPRLAATLHTASGRRIEWTTAAQSGATARFIREVLLPGIESTPIDLVIIALGVNDCLALSPARRWCAELERLLEAIDDRLGPGRIILTGVPPMQHFPALPFPLSTVLGLRAALLDAASSRLAASQAHVSHVPMDFVESPEGLFCRDGFHPNARAHALWARQLAATVNSAGWALPLRASG